MSVPGFKRQMVLETKQNNSKIDFSKSEKETKESLLFVGKCEEIATYKYSDLMTAKLEPKFSEIKDEKIKCLQTSPYNKKVLCVAKNINDGKYSVYTFDFGGDYTFEKILSSKEAFKKMKIMAMAVSPNNDFIATGGSDGYLRLFILNAGKAFLWKKLNKNITCLSISLNGTKIATGGSDKIQVVNLKGHTLATIEHGSGITVRSVLFTPSDKRILSGIENKAEKQAGSLFIHQIDYSKKENNTKLIYVNNNHIKNEQVLGLDYAFDGSKFVSSSADKTVILHSLKRINNKLITESEKILVHNNTARTVNFSPDGLCVLSGGYDSKVFFLNLVTKEKKQFMFQEEGEIRFVSFSPDAKGGLAAYSEGNVYIFDLPQGKVIFKLETKYENLRGAAFSRDGSQLITAGECGSFQVNNISLDEKVVKYSTHNQLIRAVAISPSGEKYATAGDDKEVKIFDIRSNIEIGSIPQEDWINAMVFSPDGIKLLVAGGGIEMKLFDVISGRLLQVYSGPSEWIPSIAFSPNESYVLSASTDKMVRLYKTRSGELLEVLPRQEGEGNNNNQKKRILMQTEFLWNRTNSFERPGEQNETKFPVQEEKKELYKFGSIFAVAFTNDSKSILIGGDDNDNHLTRYDLFKKEFIRLEGHNNTVRAITCFKNWPFFASGDDDGKLIIFDYEKDSTLHSFKLDSNISINSIALSPSNETLAFGTDDACIRVFDTHSDGHLVENMNHEVKKEKSNSIFSVGLISNDLLLFGIKNKPRFLNIKDKKLEPTYANDSSSLEFSPCGNYVAYGGKNLDLFNFRTGLIHTRIRVLDFIRADENLLKVESKRKSSLSAQRKSKLRVPDNEIENNEQMSISEDKSKEKNKIMVIKKIKFAKNTQIGKGDRADGKHPLFILVLVDQHIFLLDLKKNSKLCYNGNQPFTAINFSHNCDKIYAGDSQGSLWAINLKSPLEQNFNSPTNSELVGLGKFLDSEVLDIYHFVAEGHNCLLSASIEGTIAFINLDGNKKIYGFNPHKERMNSLRVNNDMTKFVTCSSDKTIRVFETLTGSQIKSFTNAEGKILSVDFSSNNYFIFACDDQHSIITYDMISGGQFNRSTASVNEDFTSIAASPNMDAIALASKQGPRLIYKFVNTSRRLSRFKFDSGSSEDENEVLDYWKSIYDKYESFRFDLNDIYILPYPLSFNKVHHMVMELGPEKALEKVHLYYMKGLGDSEPGIIELALLSQDSFGNSPWEYWLKSSPKKKMDTILKRLVDIFLVKKLPNLHLMEGKARGLIVEKIALESAQDVPKTFEFFTTKIRGVELPLSEYISGSIMEETSSCFPSAVAVRTVFEQKHPDLKGEEEIEKNDDSLGNIKSLKPKFILSFCLIKPHDLDNHLDVLASLPISHPIYQSQPFLDLIEYRWEKNGWKNFLVDAFIYIFFLIIISINCLIIYPKRVSLNQKDNSYQNAAFGLDIFIIIVLIFYYSLNEIREIRNIYQPSLLKKLKIHFSSFWNYLDISVIIFGLAFTIMDLIEISTPLDSSSKLALKVLCTIFFFSAWIRFLDFARGFNTSATLVRIIMQAIEDMKGFFMGLFFLLIGVSLTTYLLQKDYESRSHWDFIMIFYDILIGDYNQFKEIDNLIDKSLLFFILVISTILSVFIMLTLLISIISDSFNKVMALEKEAAAYEKLQNIFERGHRKLFFEDKSKFLNVLRTEIYEGQQETRAKKKNKINEQLELRRSINLMMKTFENDFREIKKRLSVIEERSENAKTQPE